MKYKTKIYILIVIASLIASITVYLNNSFAVNSFEQCLYGFMKLKGSGHSTVYSGIILIFTSFIIICILLHMPVINFGKKIIINLKNKKIQLYPIQNTKNYGILLLIISTFLLLNSLKFFPFIKNTVFSNTDIFDKYYTESNSVEISFPNKKNNLIYIFVESLESSNTSIKNGGLFEETLMPNLENLALEHINFSSNEKIGGAYQVSGTGWTAASMIAQTSGIPLKISIDDINANSINFNSITSIGDILSQNGYNNYLLVGSDASYGGRKSYFANHDYIIKDYYTAIEEGKIDKDYYEWWGYEDAKLFDFAKEMLSHISQKNKPFNFTMLTADTHFTDGYLDDTCDVKFDLAYSNSIYCSDSKIGEFLSWLKEQDFYENTTIIITGDHYSMQENFYNDSDYLKRSVYNVFINTNINNKYENKNRIFTIMDMFPTTIAALGANIKGDRLGLGTNLFSDKKTIPELIGIDRFNNELKKYSDYYYNNIRK